MSGLPGAALAFVRRDFYIQTSYKFQLLFELTGGFFVIALFYFISALMDSESSRKLLARFETDYFSYALIGVAAAGLLQTGLAGFAQRLRIGMTEGSLEMTFACPTRPIWILTLPCLWAFFFEALKGLVVVLMGVLVFGADLDRANFLSCAVILLLTITSYSVFGLLSASIILIVKRGDPINLAFAAASALIAGAFFPVELLPGWLGAIAKVLPMTYAYEGLRASLLVGASLADVARDAIVLGGFSMVGLPLAIAATSKAIRRAKMDGSLGVF
jgi:ABC-2 type transport system permease protein